MSGCKCSIVIEHEGGPEFHSEREHKARVPHKCYECGETIKPGDTYQYVSGRWDGRFDTYKTCLDCLSVRSTFFCSWTYGGLWEDFWNEADENDGKFSPDCINLLTPKAKRKVLNIIKEIRKTFHEERAS